MSKRGIKLYIEDILTAVEKIENYTKDMTFDNFCKDCKTIDAVVRNLSVIGEASKNMPEEIKQDHPEIPWEEIIGMRNKVIHEYFGVDEEILWKTAREDLPFFKDKISKIKNFDLK
jgi:uncharacterized protein with HEPN domain